MPFWKGLNGAIKIYVIWLYGSDSCDLSATVFLSKIAVLAVQFSWLQIYFVPDVGLPSRSRLKEKPFLYKCLFFISLLAFIWLLGRCECDLENWTLPIVWEKKISLVYVLCTHDAIGCFCFSCGMGIAESHHFWSLSTSGMFFLQQDSPWINVFPQSAWNSDSFFGLRWQSLFLTQFHMHIVNIQSSLSDSQGPGSSAVCPGEAGSWLAAREHLQLSAGSCLSPGKSALSFEG